MGHLPIPFTHQIPPPSGLPDPRSVPHSLEFGLPTRVTPDLWDCRQRTRMSLQRDRRLHWEPEDLDPSLRGFGRMGPQNLSRHFLCLFPALRSCRATSFPDHRFYSSVQWEQKHQTCRVVMMVKGNNHGARICSLGRLSLQMPLIKILPALESP